LNAYLVCAQLWVKRIDSGHFLPEDAAEETYAALRGFFKEGG
jgi:hypothetical protein